MLNLTNEQVTLVTLIAQHGYVPAWAGSDFDWCVLEKLGLVEGGIEVHERKLAPSSPDKPFWVEEVYRAKVSHAASH